MTTSDLLSRMYPVPSKALSDQSTRLMQMLHTMRESAPMATSAPSVSCSKGSAPISPSYSAPYLHRVCWLLSSPDGRYLRDICGTELQWATSADDVPDAQRYATFARAKSVWVRLRELSVVKDERIAINPVDFYAHPATPHYWCALHD